MGTFKLNKNSVLPIVIALIFFIIACFLQAIDDNISNWNISRFISLTAMYLFFGILAYWTVSVINRVSDKTIRLGLVTTIVLMSSVLLLKLVKYHVFYNDIVERYLWYSYYIPQCIAPVVLFLTVLGMGNKTNKKVAKLWNLLYIPAILLIFMVFTNDMHQHVFNFDEGLDKANDVYTWKWGYYLIFTWIAILYLTNGVLLFIKCRISHCRKNAWIPLVLFIACIICIVLREIFNPSFIKMPETVVFSVVIICESLIRIGFIPSNTEHAKFFDMANVSAIITDKNFNIELKSKNAFDITYDDAVKACNNGKTSLTKDLLLKSKPITGGEVFWTEDFSTINKINDKLSEINQTLSEETDLIKAENHVKEQRTKIEEQNNLYKGIFNIASHHLKKIEECFENAKSDKEKNDALCLACVYGVFIKRRSNLSLMEKDGKIMLSELVYSLRESCDALKFYNVYSSVFSNYDGELNAEYIELIFEFFEECIECALPNLSACMIRLNVNKGKLSCRIALDNVNKSIDNNWRKDDLDKFKASLVIEKSDETLFATLSFQNKEVNV